MEGNGGGGSAAAGQSVAGGAAPMAASGNWSQGNNGAGAPGGANGTSMDHYNGVHLQQLMIAQQGSTPNQLQMPTAAAAAAAGMTHNPQQVSRVIELKQNNRSKIPQDPSSLTFSD